MNYATTINPPPEKIPQSEPLNDRQVKNDAGGYVYSAGIWAQLDRFLIIGAESGTYYVDPKKHVKRNYEALKACLQADAKLTIDRIAEVSVKGLAPKQDAAIFALAVAATWPDQPLGEGANVRHYAQSKILSVCRTASTLFMFLEQYTALGGKWPRSMRTAVQNWYTNRTLDALAYQGVKYRTRNGWTHRDALLLSHLKPGANGAWPGLFHWLAKNEWTADVDPPKVIEGFIKVQEAKEAREVRRLILDYNLPREAVPTEFLKTAEVWDALLDKMPMTAMIRNLGNMGACGLLTPGSMAAQTVYDRLCSGEHLRTARIHPMNVLIAQRQYQAGHGLRGSNTWEPVSAVVSGLEKAFYLAFREFRSTGKRFMIGVDVSGSMNSLCGIGDMTAAEVAGAMSLVWAHTEPICEVRGFDTGLKPLNFTQQTSLAEAYNKTRGYNGGGTDCSMPVLWAMEKGFEFDVFVVITDNETWAGRVHPSEALRQYRQKYVPDARMIVLATESSDFTIADPNDPLSLDIAGFGSDVPSLIQAFCGGAGTEIEDSE